MYRKIAIAIACLAATAFLSNPPKRLPRTAKGKLILPNPKVLRYAGHPYINALADFYWVKTSHALGIAKTQQEYLNFYHYGDLVTRLDPKFCYAYQFVGQALPLNLGGLHGWVNVDESTEIMERGIAVCPENANERLMLSFNYSHFYRRYKDAADMLAPLVNLPETMEYIPKLVTRLYAQSGETDAALSIAEALYESAEHEDEREAYAERVKEIHLERVLQSVEAAQSVFHLREGRYPADIQELVTSGDLPRIPEDPFGGSLFLSGDDHRAYSSEQQRRLEISEKDD